MLTPVAAQQTTKAAIAQPPRLRPRFQRENWRQWIGLGAVALSCLPLLLLQFQSLWAKSHYQFFPLLLAGVGYLAWQRWPRAAVQAAGSPRVAWLLLGISLVVLAAATFLFSPWLASVAAVLLAGSVLFSLAGFRRMLTVWAALWLIVPPPFNLDMRLIQALQRVTARASSVLLDVFGFHHFMEGTVLEFPDRRMLVEEACSGIHSLFSLLTCAVLFAVWTRRPAVRAWPLILSSVVWSGLANIARVVTIAFVHARYGWDWSEGWRHDALGFATFGLAFLLVLSTDRLLEFFLAPIEASGDENRLVAFWNRLTGTAPTADDAPDHDRGLQVAEAHAPPTRRAAPHESWGAIPALALLGLIQLVVLVQLPWSQETRPEKLPALIAASTLPADMGEWDQQAYELVQREWDNPSGKCSQRWSYRAGTQAVLASFDYPFKGFHDLSVCYGNLGWKPQSQRTERTADGTHVEVELAKPTGERAFLVFCLFDRQGHDHAPWDWSNWQKLQDRLEASPVWRLMVQRGVADYHVRNTTYQFQLLLQSATEIPEPTRQAMRKQFATFRRLVHEGLRERVEGHESRVESDTNAPDFTSGV